MAENIKEKLPVAMPMLPLRGIVLYPKMILNFDIGREKSILALNSAMQKDQLIYLVAQKNIQDDEPGSDALYTVGTVAHIRQQIKTQAGGSTRVLVEGLYRAKTLEIVSDTPHFMAVVEEYPLQITRKYKTALVAALMRTVKELFQEYCFLSPRMPKEIIINSMATDDPVYLVEYIAGNVPVEVSEKQKILEISDITKRLEYLARLIENENIILNLEHDVYEKVHQQVDKNQREYYLREQIKVISAELGESESPMDEAREYRQKIEKIGFDAESKAKLIKETEKLAKLPPSSHESGVVKTYLDEVLALPWNKKTTDKIEIAKAKTQLDNDHYGLEKVKEKILETMAVRQISPKLKGQTLCLVGPPGVGKTSIARSIAKTMGRKYARISLGGVRDEAEIRGHRKTYIGSMPGRIINAIKQSGSANPLIVLDEIDKLANDYRGDPSSALLEVLDSEQNFSFRDHYLEIPFDLSDIFFVCTANDLSEISPPLRDRMDIINLSSYTRIEKFNIAKKHLLPKQLKKHSITAAKVKIDDSALYGLIDSYTREAGVRTLEREIASLIKKGAKQYLESGKKAVITAANLFDYLGPAKYHNDLLSGKNEIGLVNGLAWTSVGGELLQVEAVVLDGSGKLELTGSLGDVMKESAKAAVTYIRTVAEKYNIDQEFYKNRDIHLHFPEGAVPKDGPSAGIAISTALVSVLSGIPVKSEVAMTGEVTLRGRVLPIGGLKEKTMAAYRAGVKKVIIPKENMPDLHEIDPEIKNAIEFVPAETVETVFEHALAAKPKRIIMPKEKIAPQPNYIEEILVKQ